MLSSSTTTSTTPRLRPTISDNDIYLTADNSLENLNTEIHGSIGSLDYWGRWFKRIKRFKRPPFYLIQSKQVELLKWSDMPRHLQFNPYILTGYRPLLSVWGSLHSLFYLHNETINIISHGIPIVYILTYVPSYMPWGPDYWFLSWCHILGSVSPWIGSFIYHLFMNLKYGERVYHKLLQLDMLGIWISQSFGALPMIIATVFCFPTFFRWLITTLYCVISLWGLYKALIAWSPWERRLSFLLPFTMRVLLGSLRATKLAGGAPTAFAHIVLQDLVAIIGVAIGALHIPEKWCPGRVDMYLNSHNIMHVLVVFAVYSMHQATILDLAWMSTNQQCHLTYNSNVIINNTPIVQHIEAL